MKNNTGFLKRFITSTTAKGEMSVRNAPEAYQNQSQLDDKQWEVLCLFGIKTAGKPESTGQENGYTVAPDEISSVLEDLAMGSSMDEEMILQFDDKVFSLKYFQRLDCTPGRADIRTVPEIFCRNKYYMEVLRVHERIHSPERARLKVSLEECEGDEDALWEAIDDMSDTYERICAGTANMKYLNIVWVKFLDLLQQYSGEVPEALLNYITKDNYRSLFVFVRNQLNKNQRKGSSVDKRNGISQAKKVCRYILDYIEENDVPARLLLGKLYQQEGAYTEAEAYFNTLIDKNSFNGVTALGDCYDAEIHSLLAEIRSGNNHMECINRIRIINNKLENLYIDTLNKLGSQISSSMENRSEYRKKMVSLSCRYARWQKDRGYYEKCYRILEGIPDCYPEYYRVLLEKGMLCQHTGRGKKANRYFDLQKAVQYFAQALVEMDEQNINDISKAKKSALIPLANTLYTLKDYEGVYKSCREVLELDPKEKNAYRLLKKIGCLRDVENF